MSHYQGMATEYKGQLERNRLEREELDKTLRLREQEIDQLKREMQLEAEKVCNLAEITMVSHPPSL